MQINILFFGILRDVANCSTISLAVSEGTTLANLRQQLAQLHPKLNAFKNYSIAVNEVYADGNCIVKENDVIALIPPVSGG
tara:strand:+ start:91264 stop:91506 length:243 start_codon:yes stop_codon:yes gene_type:complete